MALISTSPPTYRGRFAPSPTGPLHMGSLVAALGSYLEAKARGGSWLLRIEDVDLPRCQPGAEDDILRVLEAFGFAWEGPLVHQSERSGRYQAALDQLKRQGLAFACACSRRELADSARAIDGSLRYPGTCRNGLADGRSARAWRLRVPDEDIVFDDRVQGTVARNLAQDCGDFVLLRADGFFAYQLAVTVDDADQGITHVVRGADLIESAPRQIWLQRCLGLVTPAYAHLPVVLDGNGEKLSKQTLAAPVQPGQGVVAMHAALCFLGQSPPPELSRASLPTLWQWALEHWSLDRVPKRMGDVLSR